MKVRCRVCGRMVHRAGIRPHSAMHKRKFAKAVGRKGTDFLGYEYIVAYFNPLQVSPALAGWVACAEGQRRLTEYIEK